MSPSGGRKVAFAPECKTNNEVATTLWSCRHLRLRKLFRSETASLLAVWSHRENGLDAGHVELLGAVIAIDTVLLLLDIGELGVAVATNVVRQGQEHISEGFETGVELLK